MNYQNNFLYRRPMPMNRPGYGYNNNRVGNFLFPFALGFVSSPLIFGATRPRPVYPYNPGYGNYFPYY